MKNWLQKLTGETQFGLVALLRRSRQTINSLADSLRLTDNAVRNHIAVLSRDGIVEDAGVHRDTGGKPARMYALTAEGEELFPKAYALVLGKLIDEMVRSVGRDRSIELLRATGARMAAGTNTSAEQAERVQDAAAILRSVGADIDVVQTEKGWTLQGYGCPLSAVTSHREEACALVTSIVEEATGAPRVAECCQRGSRPKCRFDIEAA